MEFISTRGKAQPLSFREAMLSGLASDGGLYVPRTYPSFTADEISDMAKLSYAELAYKILAPFMQPDISETELKELIEASYNNDNFSDKTIAPLRQIDTNHFVLELFHGPTLAFKDFALQFFGRLLNLVLKKSNEQAIIIGATSGDTGSAAISGCYHCDNAKIFILHPNNKVSDIQRKQMTTYAAENIFNLAVEGNFDDCQEIVKTLFLNKGFVPERTHLISVNSINCARILAQIVYYFYAALRLGAPFKKVSFSVPTGNFGDVFAGYLAKQMGLPIEKLIVATNTNNILDRFMRGNKYDRSELQESLSPSMNIQVASNFERLLFDSYNRDASAIDDLMTKFKATSKLSASENAFNKIKADFLSYKCDDVETIKTMQRISNENDYTIDPHTATAVYAADEYAKQSKNPVISLATAHPAKFGIACEKAKVKFHYPKQLTDIDSKAERFQVIANSYDAIAQYIKDNI